MDNLIYRGSVKDLFQAKESDSIIFNFSDRYSVFDWGEMPDTLSQKGECLAFCGHFLFKCFENPEQWRKIENKLTHELRNSAEFKQCKSSGINTHLQSFVDKNDDNTEKVTNKLKVKKVDIIRPEFKDGRYDYSLYQEAPSNCLVPLEVIFRFGVPQGSSLLKRVQDSEYREAISLDHIPTMGETFESPIIEYSTKLETSDRYIYPGTAQKIAGLTSEEEKSLATYSRLLSYMTKEIFEEIVIEVWDGKFEFAFITKNGKREFMLVDTIGPDELRLTYKEVSLSKENIRQAYINTPWHQAVSKAKDLADSRGVKEWKEICVNELNESPQKLSALHLDLFSNLYKVVANELSLKFLGQSLFTTWDLEKLCTELKRLKNE